MLPLSTLKTEIAQLGEPQGEFKSINTLLILGWLGGIFFLVSSVGVACGVTWLLLQGTFDIRMASVGYVPMGLLLGWETAQECWGRLGGRVTLYERGFVFRTRRSSAVFPWDRVKHVFFDDASAAAGPSSFPRVQRQTGFTVHRDDEQYFTFSVYTLRNHMKLAKAVFKATRARGIDWFGPSWTPFR